MTEQRRAGLLALLFCLGALCLNWPLVSLFFARGLIGAYVALFLAWAAFIAALALLAGRPEAGTERADADADKGPGHD